MRPACSPRALRIGTESANCGWVVAGEAATLVDLPRSVKIVDFLSEARRIGGKPIRSVVLTHLEPGDAAIVAELPRHGVESIITTPAIRDRLVAGMGKGSTSIQVRRRAIGPAGRHPSPFGRRRHVEPGPPLFSSRSRVCYLPVLSS